MREIPYGSESAALGIDQYLDMTAGQSSPQAQYRPYRPQGSHFTPPASPHHHPSPPPSATKSGFSEGRSRTPANIYTGSPTLAAYERPTYSPSPTSSPPLPPALPSPQFPPRKQSRAGNGAGPSPLNDGFPRAEQGAPSPVHPPQSGTMRQASGPTLPLNPRPAFNPLACNPVKPENLTVEKSRHVDSWMHVQNRARGQTTSSQNSFHHPLRTATSIPDYGAIRTSIRSLNQSALYRPDRGGPSAPVNDSSLFSRQWTGPRGDECRDSVQSGWTNTSSAFLNASGTERSSILTKSSDNRGSMDSKELFDRQSLTEENTQPTEPEDDVMSVEDAIDLYMYEDRHSQLNGLRAESSWDEGYISQATAAPSPDRISSQGPLDEDIIPESDIPPVPDLPPNVETLEPRYMRREDWESPRRQVSQATEGPPSKIGQIHQWNHSSPKQPSLDLKEISPLKVTSPNQKEPLLVQEKPNINSNTRPRRASNDRIERRSRLFMPVSPMPQRAQTLEFNTDNDIKKERLESTRRISESSMTQSQPSFGNLGPSSTRDEYGFMKTWMKINVGNYDEWYTGSYKQHLDKRHGQWVKLCEKQKCFDPEETKNDPGHEKPPKRFPPMSRTVQRYIQKGIPPKWRGRAWWFYGGGPEAKTTKEGLYEDLLRQVKDGKLGDEDREVIERDLHRTFPENIHFRPDPVSPSNKSPDATPTGEDEEAPMISRLRDILQAFAVYNPKVGYCQSLNFLAGLLLLVLQDDEKAFIMLTVITDKHFPGMHAPPLLGVDQAVLFSLIKKELPDIYQVIDDTTLQTRERGKQIYVPTVNLSTTAWLMGLYVPVMPIETVLRIWDVFMVEGAPMMFRVALKLFKSAEGEFLRTKGDRHIESLGIVQALPRSQLDPNKLFDGIWSRKFAISRRELQKARASWKEVLTPENTNAPRLAAAPTKSGEEEKKEKKNTGVLRRTASRKFRKVMKA